ncbi:MAG: AAA family ATPase [Neisseria sp.]|nr:AAA family ATPase [Neisseria sp.]
MLSETIWAFPLFNPQRPIDWQALEARFDWFAAMRGVPQDRIWHAEGDVFTHTKMVCEALLELAEFQNLPAQEQHILFAAALLHDVEKRTTTREETIGGIPRIISPKHAKKGEYTARKILYTDLAAPFAIREQIAKLVRLHGLPLWAIEKNDPEKAAISASLNVSLQHLALLAEADILGRICADQNDILLRIDLFRELARENNCLEQAYPFADNLTRFDYLNRGGGRPDYIPFDTTTFEAHIMCALPGSGKDTFISRHLNDIPALSLDDIRRKHKISPGDKQGTGKVVQLAREEAKSLLRRQQTFVFNATNITAAIRGKWLDLFHQYGARVKIHYIEVPYSRLLSQNRNREHAVPEKVLNDLLNKLEMPGFEEAREICPHIAD